MEIQDFVAGGCVKDISCPTTKNLSVQLQKNSLICKVFLEMSCYVKNTSYPPAKHCIVEVTHTHTPPGREDVYQV